MARPRKKKSGGSRVMKALKKYVRKAAKSNPAPRRVKGSVVRLRNFTGTVIKKRNGQIMILGRARKK
jgi:hypothetical protein